MESSMNVPKDETTEDVLKLLQCPVCFETPMIKPRLCETGHSTCSDCIAKIDKCALCKKKFTGIMNFVAEDIAASLKFFCKYREHGCAVIETSEKLKTHQSTCSYNRTVLCQTTPCNNEAVNVCDLISHLKIVHGCPGTDEAKDTYLFGMGSLLDASPGASCLYYFRFDEKYFIFQTLYDQHNIHWWIYLIGSSQQAKNYQYELTILPNKESLRNKNVKIKYNLPVQSVYDEFEKIAVAGELASNPRGFLKALSTIKEENQPNEVLQYMVEVKIINC